MIFPAIFNRFAFTLALAGLFLWPAAARSIELDLAPPGDREFVRDLADMIKPEDEQKIKLIADKLLSDKATPIIVVTIEDMAGHGGDGMRIETFATLLFNQWQIGQAKLEGQAWNTGILLLVSKGDRKARIELGAGWRRDQDALCQRIMDEQIIPRFKQEEFSAGIVAGVEGLEAMARGLQLPAKPVSPWAYVAMLAAVGLVIFTIVSLIRRGASGWAWLFWGALFAGVGWLLWSMLNNSGRSSGGGFSGGSFGGGFSGGGGASGSW